MMSGDKALSNDLPWQVAQLDLIAFRIDPSAGLNNDWWSELTGAECESVRRKNERVDSGRYQGHMLRVASDILRTTWTLAPYIEVDIAEGFPGPPVVGPMQEVFDLFVPLMNQWLEASCPQVTRLAINAKLYQFGESREDNYALLAKYLPSVEVDPTSRELQYRINRTRESRVVPNLTINRLNTWSSIALTTMIRAGSSPTASPHDIRTIEKAYHACMTQLDINTSQDWATPLPHDDLVGIWSELVDYAWEIARCGDVK